MPKYRVQIDASNFLVDVDGRVAKHGFITIRWVEANSATDAEKAAVQMIREDQDLRALVKNDPGDPPVMDVLEIAEVESFDGIGGQPGRIWYEMQDRKSVV